MTTTGDPTVATPPAATAAPPLAVSGPDEVRATRRAGTAAMCVFGTWVVVGLFLDGWAHNVGKPESFFTPWHGLLYSGFVAGMAWAGISEARLRRRGIVLPVDRLAVVGFGAFAVGGVADMVWHQVFGIEEDIAALLSPSHLLLMAAGLLLVTEPVRVVLDLERDAVERGEPQGWASFAPVAVGMTLLVAVLSFFGQFASGMHIAARFVWGTDAGDAAHIQGITSLLLATLLLVGALVWVTGPWPRPPAGAFTLTFGGAALLMAGLNGFDEVVLVVPVALGGALADVLLARGVAIRPLAAAVPAAMWTAWFVTYDLAFGLGWAAELTSGTVVLCTLVGYGVALLATSPRPARTA
jgi:hypothetical protein